jgi:prolyl oligopeptidase
LYGLLSWVSLAVLAWSDESLAQALTYPAAQLDSVVEDFYGTRVADPYRWLEDLEAPHTTEWVRAESRLTLDYLAHLPDRDAIRRRLAELRNYRRTGVPWREGRQLFFVENSGLQQQPVLSMLERPDQTPRIVLDPQAISLDGSNAIDDFAVSPDGRWLAYSSSPGGADVGETHVRELGTGRERDVVRGTWSTVCWTYDGGGFFYMRPPAPKPGEALSASRIAKQLFYHRMGLPQEHDRLIHEWHDARWLYAMLSDDGRRVIVVMERGPHSWMYSMDLRNASTPQVSDSLVPLLGEVGARHTPMGTVGHTLYVFTDLGASVVG